MKTVSYRGEDNLRRWGTSTPKLGARVMIDPSAAVLGDIEIGDDVSIWANCSVRADVHSIRIGNRTNVQDNSVLHVTHASRFNPDGWPLTIGDDVTVGHRAVLHGCSIGDRVLVGMGAIVMDGVIVENDVMIAGGALVTPGKRLESGMLYAGSPARPVRPMSEQEKTFLGYSAQNYAKLKQQYLDDNSKSD